MKSSQFAAGGIHNLKRRDHSRGIRRAKTMIAQRAAADRKLVMEQIRRAEAHNRSRQVA